MFTLNRKELTLFGAESLEYSQGSFNTRLLLVNDGTYPEYVESVHCSYFSYNSEVSIILEKVDQTNVFIIPGEVFAKSGPVRFSIALSNTSITPEELIKTASITYEVVKAPSGTVVLPSTRDWQSYVREYLNAQVPLMVEYEVSTDIEPYLTIIQEGVDEANLAATNAQTSAEEASRAADIVSTITPRIENLETDILQLSNDNLIDNPNFKINQRLLNEYEGVGIYSIDRWKIHGGGGKVSVVNGVVSMFANKSNTMTLEQLLLNGTLIPGKEYTLSSSIIEESVSFTYETTGSWNIPTSFGKIDVYNPTSGYVQVRFVINSGNTVTFDTNKDFIKLEPGMFKTPYISPNSALELEKCKYFCEVFGSNGFFRCLEMLRGGSESIVYTLPITEKVTTPTMNFSGTFLVRQSNNIGIKLSDAVPSESTMSKKNAGIEMTKTTTEFPTEQTHLVLDNAKIIVSADLF